MSEQNTPSTPNNDEMERFTGADLVSKPAPSQAPSFLKEAVDYLEMFVFAVCAVILVFSFSFRFCTVDGKSMDNTLAEGENLVVSNLFFTPERGDIVVFHQTGPLNEPIVKRVIATAGERVSVTYDEEFMTVRITDTTGRTVRLVEPYVKYDTKKENLYSPMSVTVPEGKIFVMGDNRKDSLDSRSQEIGLVDERRILGRVLFRVTPFSRFGAVQ